MFADVRKTPVPLIYNLFPEFNNEIGLENNTRSRCPQKHSRFYAQNQQHCPFEVHTSYVHRGGTGFNLKGVIKEKSNLGLYTTSVLVNRLPRSTLHYTVTHCATLQQSLQQSQRAMQHTTAHWQIPGLAKISMGSRASSLQRGEHERCTVM